MVVKYTWHTVQAQAPGKLHEVESMSVSNPSTLLPLGEFKLAS